MRQKTVIAILFFATISLLNSGNINAACQIMQGLEKGVNSADQFDLQKKTEGFYIEACVLGQLVSVNRVKEPVKTDMVTYLTTQNLCRSESKVKIQYPLDLDFIQELEFACELSELHVRMCHHGINKCVLPEINDFVAVENVNVLQFEDVVYFIKKIALNTGEAVNGKVLSNLDNESIKVIKKIQAAGENLKLLYVDFNDYTDFLYPGTVYAIARQNLNLFKFIFKPDREGLILEKAYIVVE